MFCAMYALCLCGNFKDGYLNINWKEMPMPSMQLHKGMLQWDFLPNLYLLHLYCMCDYHRNEFRHACLCTICFTIKKIASKLLFVLTSTMYNIILQ